jgi:hypothetical protein
LKELAEARGFTEEFLTKCGISVDDDPEYPIVIQYPHMTGVWHVRRRRWMGDTRQPKYRHPKGETARLFNPRLLGPNASMVWFAEGEFDALALIATGIPAIGVPGASSFRRVARHLYTSALVVIAFDGDAAGREASAKTAGVFAQDKATVYEFDPGLTDTDPPAKVDLNDLHKQGELEPALVRFAGEYGLDLWPEPARGVGGDTVPAGEDADEHAIEDDTASVPEGSTAGPEGEGEDTGRDSVSRPVPY